MFADAGSLYICVDISLNKQLFLAVTVIYNISSVYTGLMINSML